MKLLIVESPSKAKTINKYLGKDYIVSSSKGHILDLPKKEFGIDLNNFNMKFEIMEGKEAVVKELKDLIKKCDEVLIATDPDREGEAIAFHISKMIPKGKPFKRVVFEEIRKSVILKAIENATEIDENVYNAQKTRRVLDRIMGYKISPLLWKKISPGLSAGRVQSVGLRIILEKEKQIRKFVPEEYYTLDAFVKDEVKISYLGKEIDKKDKLKDKEESEKILDEIKNKKVFVIKKESKELKEYPKPPFSTSDLQQEAFKKLGLSSKETMQIAQKLYEGKSLGKEGTHGLISYMRTDSYRINEEKMNDLNLFVKENFPDYSVDKNYSYTKEGSNQDAHEAIRPTSIKFNPEKIKNFLEEKEYKLYELIWKRFISSQMSPAIYEQSSVIFKIENYFFSLTGKLQKSKGFLEVYNYTKKTDVILPSFEEGEELEQVKEPLLKENFTKPPQRYTEASLIKMLEKKGVGRPSTYATIISNIKDKKYILEKDGRLFISKIGEILCESLLSSFKKVFELNFTANIEKKLDKISEGKEDYKELLSNFWEDLSSEINYSDKEMVSLKEEKIPTGMKCSQCPSGKMFLYSSGISKIECDRCNHSETGVIVDNKFKKKKYKGKICIKCNNGFLIERNGKYGKFLACNSSSCDYISPITTNVKCKQCNTGEYVERKSKKGNLYYTCSLPHCEEVLFNKIIKKKCLSCGNHFLIKKEGKNQCPVCLNYEDLIK